MKNIIQKMKSEIFKQILQKIGKKSILNYILDDSEKEALIYINSGYLNQKGWWKSWSNKEPINLNGTPLPWVTYSFIDFIKNRLNIDMVIFEFGSGNSTLFYSNMVKEVRSVEHSLAWYEKIVKTLPDNVEINRVDLDIGGYYSRAAINSDIKYDIIIVDGRDRVNCIKNSIQAIKYNGVIILDDSEREKYLDGIEELRKSGFKSLDFWGISPGFMAYNKCTSIYYKEKNVLKI